jgi:hypothetical protein
MHPFSTFLNNKVALYYKLCLLVMLSLFSVQEASALVTVTVPSIPGTDTSSFTPTNRRYAYSASRMLFTAAEIGTTGTIRSLSFQKYSGSTSTSINYITIYMKETTATTVTTAVPTGFPTGYKRVYFSSFIDNTMTSGWTTITLSTALSDIFTYSGGANNLDIVIVKTTSEAATPAAYPVFTCNTTAATMSAYYYSATAALGATFTTTSLKRPNIKLDFDITCAGKPATGTITGPAGPVCSGANFTLTGTGVTVGTGMQYQWQSRNAGTGPFTNTSAADTFASLTTSTTVNKDYRVYSVCTLSGQSDTAAAFTVNVMNPVAITAATDTTFCSGGSVNLYTTTVAGSGITYTWFNGATNLGATGPTYSASSSGVYSLRSSSAACAGLFSNAINVTVNPLPVATVTPTSATTFCDGLFVQLQASTGAGYVYQWQKGGVDIAGATSSNYNATTSGSYRVVITNSATGCSNTSSAVVVTVNPMPATPVITSAGGAAAYCRFDSLLLSATSVSGVSYQWESLSGPIAGATSNTYMVKTPNVYVLKATIGPCTATSNSLTINENPLPTATITPSGTVSFCNGDSLKIQASVSAGVTYSWLESGMPISGGPTTSFYYAKTAGVYSVKITNTTTGCSNTSGTLTVTIITPSIPTIAAGGPTTFCKGGSVTLNATVASGLTMQWQESGTNILGAVTASYIANTSGVYRMKVTNGVGCAGYSTPITVVVNPLPNNALTITGGTDICNGSTSVILAPTAAGYHYQWRNLGVDIAGAIGNPYYVTTAGTYSVHIVDTNGCESTSIDVPVTVKFVKAFTVQPYGNTFFCDGDTTKLVTQKGFTSYQWFFNGVYIPGATDTFVYATAAGKYSVQVQDPTNACYATSPGFNISVIPAPAKPDIIHVGSRLSTSIKGVSYQWYKNGVAIPGATDSFITITSLAVYAIQVTNDNGCSKMTSIDLNPTAIQDPMTQSFVIKVYPNPTKDKLLVEAPSSITVALRDLQGRTLFLQKGAQQIDMTAYAIGIYLIQFIDEHNQIVATEKVSKID